MDIAPEMLAFYAFSINEAGDMDMAKAMLNRAKKLGVSKATLERVIRDPDNTAEFIAKLSRIGAIN